MRGERVADNGSEGWRPSWGNNDKKNALSLKRSTKTSKKGVFLDLNNLS